MDPALKVALFAWTTLPPATQWLRHQALQSLYLLGGQMVLAEATDAARTPREWVRAWDLLAPTGEPSPWVIDAVTIHRDFVSFFKLTTFAKWMIPILAPSHQDPPPPPMLAHVIGAAAYKRMLAEYADRVASRGAPAHLSDRAVTDGHLSRDLAFWASAVLAAVGQDVSLSADLVNIRDRRARVRAMAQRLDLAPPQGRPRGRPTRR